jgi:AcrR family transcriptional regulator
LDANGRDPGRLTRRERTRQQHRDEIISAATGLFARHGYEGTSMQMIADQAEISVGKLYLHFKGKEDIYSGIVEYHVEEIRRRADEEADPTAPPLDRIRSRIRAVIKYVEENEAIVRFYIEEMEGMGRGCCHMDESGHPIHTAEFTELVREAIRRGDIPDEDPDLITAMIQGAGHAMMEVVVEKSGMPYSTVADYVDRMILIPLEERKRDEKRKEGGG